MQDNKAVNLALAAPKINGILIRPGETFSFWHLVGRPSAANGYRTGMVIANAQTGEAVGGGMCQFSNLIHWMVLHAPLTITEQHHHDQFDLFPDFGRQVPFGTGTSIFYNYLDYRFRNDTEQTYQLLVHTTPTHLCGELRTDAPLAVKYHIAAENERFVREDGVVYRCGEVYRTMVDKTTGNVLSRELLRRNHARVLYDTAGLEIMDRVGGGDSFASGLIYGLMTTENAEMAVNYGAAHGALAMTTPGDTTMASKKEVEAIMGGAGARVQR